MSEYFRSYGDEFSILREDWRRFAQAQYAAFNARDRVRLPSLGTTEYVAALKAHDEAEAALALARRIYEGQSKRCALFTPIHMGKSNQ